MKLVKSVNRSLLVAINHRIITSISNTLVLFIQKQLKIFYDLEKNTIRKGHEFIKFTYIVFTHMSYLPRRMKGFNVQR